MAVLAGVVVPGTPPDGNSQGAGTMTRKSSSASERVLYDWSPEALTKARALWDAGYSASEIGRAIGTSKNSLVGKAHRLGWPSRPSPIKPPTGRKPHVRRIVDRPTLPPLRSVACAMTAPRFDPEIPAARSCQWIADEPSRRATFCGAPAQRGSSYCAEHHARCWIARPVLASSHSEIGPMPMRDGRADDRGKRFLPD